MNKQRRKEINAVVNKMYGIQNKLQSAFDDTVIYDALSDICSDVQSIYEDEEYYMNNIPENMQSGQRYASAEEACNNLENAIDSIEYAMNNVNDKDNVNDSIEEAIGYLNDASV